MLDIDSINLGFSRKARVYDDYGAAHPAIQRTRGQVRARVESLIPPDSHILELNAGTGEDAAYFAERGYHVHATDVAEGMLAEIHHKVETRGLHDRLTVQPLSVMELASATGGPFDLVFSNFGGLNCVPDLRPVAEQLPRVLRPGGYVVWVIMPRVCPWELAQALRGRFAVAFRRVGGATRANVEGAYFTTYYFSALPVQRALGSEFKVISLQSLSLFSPPAFMDGFPHRFPRLFRWLTAIDARVTHWPLLNTMGDFVIVTERYLSPD
ncbi:MAG: class I SAM-dependent methyltransferase [Anaerolineales bacterium]